MHYLKLALTRRFIGIVTIVMTGMFWATPIVQAQWTPPIGIPVPPFGITQVAPPLPNPWTSNVSGFYYVREGGTNTGNGYPTNPRNDIPRTLPAGNGSRSCGHCTLETTRMPISSGLERRPNRCGSSGLPLIQQSLPGIGRSREAILSLSTLRRNGRMREAQAKSLSLEIMACCGTPTYEGIRRMALAAFFRMAATM